MPTPSRSTTPRRHGVLALALLLAALAGGCNVGYEPVLQSEPAGDTSTDSASTDTASADTAGTDTASADSDAASDDTAAGCGIGCNQWHMCCDERCVEHLRDPLNCGACGNVCVQGAQCVGGICRCTVFGQECEVAAGDHCEESTCRCGSSSACDSNELCSASGCQER